jgi:hypothetical protein
VQLLAPDRSKQQRDVRPVLVLVQVLVQVLVNQLL